MTLARSLFVTGAVFLLLYLLNHPASPVAEAGSNVIYVNRSASGAQNGASWVNAYRSLTDALQAADSGDEIWVARGVYVPGALPTSTFTISPGVAVYGGFAGTENSRGQRDWRNHVTVLSGDIDNNDVKDETGTVERPSDIVGRNAYTVVTMNGAEGTPVLASTRLDGFTITAGYANGDSFPDTAGGGLFCEARDIDNGSSECSPTLENLVFRGNFALDGGGAIYLHGRDGRSNATLTQVLFQENGTEWWGGALFNNGINGESSPVLTTVTFQGNQAALGGALYNDGSSMDGASDPILTHVIFSGNEAEEYGGAIYNAGEFDGSASPRITNALFSGNRAGYDGGAIYNNAPWNGSAAPALINATFSGNHAERNGGAVFNNGDGAGTAAPHFINSIFWGNQATEWGNQMYSAWSSATFEATLVEGGWNGSGIENEESVIHNGGGNIAADPRFIAPVGTDGFPGTLDDDLRLRAGSPAIDAGRNAANHTSLDLGGNPRRVDGDGNGTVTIDMGAYESPPAPPHSYIYLPFVSR